MIDNSFVRGKQVERIKKVREGRDESKVREALQLLSLSARAPPSSSNDPSLNLLLLSIQAARYP
ncbi:hypothetical protein NL529_34920, partial [Klebsiella pneumoniae]|nr:hypothetical protein [Klebsiella pneumoniae]